MKAPARLLHNTASPRATAGLFACAMAGALMAGCVGSPFREAKVDPQSPIADEATRALHAKGAYPRFRDIPAKPTDVRPKAQYGVAAAQIETVREQLEAATAPSTWTLTRTDSFAAAARQAAGPEIPAGDPAATAAFAEALRKRATPPPPPKR